MRTQKGKKINKKNSNSNITKYEIKETGTGRYTGRRLTKTHIETNAETNKP